MMNITISFCNTLLLIIKTALINKSNYSSQVVTSSNKIFCPSQAVTRRVYRIFIWVVRFLEHNFFGFWNKTFSNQGQNFWKVKKNDSLCYNAGEAKNFRIPLEGFRTPCAFSTYFCSLLSIVFLKCLYLCFSLHFIPAPYPKSGPKWMRIRRKRTHVTAKNEIKL